MPMSDTLLTPWRALAQPQTAPIERAELARYRQQARQSASYRQQDQQGVAWANN
ncbi:hypothetical protein [Aeromonas molluscorum]|uniref:hypothetical protein n=1 Tax=Aeromonas molluscorum TaxID=271417 RepID=UPI003F1BA89D